MNTHRKKLGRSGNLRLRQARRQLGIAQMRLAIEAPAAVGIISAVERHGYVPGPAVRARLAKALNVAPAALWPELEAAL